MNVEEIKSRLDIEIKSYDFGKNPVELYEPIHYLMALSGKRMRPLLTILGYSLFKEDWQSILKPAIAVEVFHNFTLMHDDIMDNAPLRRGKPTVHEKWNNNIAILSGDVMLVKAYDLLLFANPSYLPPIIRSFNQCAAEVCEGQQFDMNFETRSEVSEDEYLEMIRLKTAVLLGFALELGGMLAGADQESLALLRDFGQKIGIGFQLKDDYLDVYGDAVKFGKQVGGDIIANKKTYLLIEALVQAKGKLKEELEYWISLTEFDKDEKVKAVTHIYNQLDIPQLCKQKINQYFMEGFEDLEKIKVSESKKAFLKKFTEQIIHREK
jgi:geranylgeranyl diphosphate synthase type II